MTKLGKLAAIYASPLLRAVQTTEIVGAALALDMYVVEGPREWNLRDNMRRSDFLPLDVAIRLSFIWALRYLLAHELVRNPNLQSFICTVADSIDGIASMSAGERLLVVSHWGTSHALLTHFFPEFKQWEVGKVRHCALTYLEIDATAAKMLSFNDHAFLGRK